MARPFVVLLLAVLTLPVLSISAQEPTPEPGPEASKLLPEASALGDG